MKLLHFGAGNIGRSLVGPLFAGAGYVVTFVDTAAEIVTALQERGSYRVVIKDRIPPGASDSVEVAGVTAIDAADRAAVTAAVAAADLIGTSVGAAALPAVVRSMVPGLQQRRQPVSILLCENLHGAVELVRQTLRAALPPESPLAEQTGLVATSIGKMVPLMPAAVRQRDPLEVWGEAYNQIIADRHGFAGTPPQVAGLILQANFQAWVERKLFIHNLGHATCAVLGARHGEKLIASALAHPEVAAITRAAMMASATALIRKYPTEFNSVNQQEHVDDLLRRFANRALGDTVYRVGRDLPRKLAADDRFIGALRLVAATGGDVDPLCRSIAAALHFDGVDEAGKPYEPDVALRAAVAAEGVVPLLVRHAALDPLQFARELKLIEEYYHEFA